MTAIVIVDDAAQQLADIAVRWRDHRSAAPTLPLDAVVYIIAIWGAPRMGDPDLVDPR